MKTLRILTAIGLTALVALTAAADIDLPTREVNGKTFYYYEVPPKATVYSITRTYGITREELIKYNPQVQDGLRAGDTLLFPVKDAEEAQPAEQPEPEAEPEAEPISPISPIGPISPITEPEPESEPTLNEPEPESTLNVAVMLPFMLESENMTRQTENHTNFYRGMLMAVDSLAPRTGMKVNLYAFDTENSAARALQQTRRPEFATMDFIIAPGDSLTIEGIAAAADSTDATVINLFAVRNDAHKRHESVVQANIPHADMYSLAANAFCKKFAGRKTIILNATDIPADKSSFVELLTATLVKAGIPYEQIDFAGKLTDEDLTRLPARDYVFIPTSSSREMLMKITPALADYAASSAMSDINLFGYPDWVVIRGELCDRLHRLSTVIYSRFSTDLDGADVAAVQRSHARWYGMPIPESVPNTTLLGFDTMAWLISASERGLTEPFEGLQNTFKIADADTDAAGSANRALYFVTFAPSGAMNAEVL